MKGIFNLLKGKKSRLVIAADVGSYSIKTSVFEITEGNRRISIIKNRVFFLPFFGFKDGILEEAKITASRLREIIFNFLKEIKRVPDKILIGLDNSLVKSSIEIFQFVRPDPKKIVTKEELDNLLDAAIEDKKKKIADQGETVVWAMPILFSVDGYVVHDFNLNISGKEISFKIFILILDVANWKELAAIPKMLGGVPVEFTSLLFHLGEAIAKKMPDGKECFILDIGGSRTNAIIVREGKLSEVVGFNIGGDSFSRRLAEEFEISPREASGFKKQYFQGIATEHESKKISDIFSNEARVFEEAFVKSLDNISQDNFFPKAFYIVGGGANILEIKNVLESKNWSSNVLFSGSVAFSYLKPDDILGKISFDIALKGFDEVGLASLIVNS